MTFHTRYCPRMFREIPFVGCRCIDCRVIRGWRRLRRVVGVLVWLALAASVSAQIRPNPTGTSGTLFWSQPAESLQTAQAYTYRYYIDTNATPIAMSASCAGTASPYECNGPLSTLASGTHDYILEVVCSTCTTQAVKALPITYNNAGSNGLVAPTGLRMESASGANIPPLASIIDKQGATWTQSPTPPTACPPSVASSHPPAHCLSQMRNGVVLGLGAEIFYSNGSVYVSGPSGAEMHWWRYNAANDWTDVGTGKPTR